MISQFDVVPNPVTQARKIRPFYLSLQDWQLDHLRTRIMAPLLIVGAQKEPNRLNPHFQIENRRVYLDPTDLVTMHVRHLGSPVANLQEEHYRIISALDLVFTRV